MTKTEFDALPAGDMPSNPERLLELARYNRDSETRAYKSFSGADVADAPIHGYVADALGCIAQGKDLEATLALFDRKWREYAIAQQNRVAAAPKIKRGPSSGHSTIHHRWVSESAWEYKGIFIRSLVKYPV